MDKQVRYDLRKRASLKIFGDGSFKGIGIKSVRDYERTELWPHSTALCQRVILSKYPHLATDPKHRAKAKQTANIIFLYYRLGWSASEIARNMKFKTPAVELRIRRIAALARKLIMENNLLLPDGETFFPIEPAPRRGRVLVSSFKVVTNRPHDLRWLCTLSDMAIREQAIKALDEAQNQEQEISAVCNDFSLLAAA